MRLLFPYGERPGYYFHWGMETKIAPVSYSITANGQELPFSIRHLWRGGEQVELSYEDFEHFYDSYWEDDFFHPELPVTRYTYKIHLGEVTDKLSQDGGYLGFTLPKDQVGYRIGVREHEGMGTVGDGSEVFAVYMDPNRIKNPTIEIFVFGEPLTEDLTPRAFERRNSDYTHFYDEVPCKSATMVQEEQMRFLELTKELKAEEWDFSELDWYNAMAIKLSEEWKNSPIPFLTMDRVPPLIDLYWEEKDAIDWGEAFHPYGEQWQWETDMAYHMVCCYEYSLTIGPGERMVHTVTAPVYPSITENLAPMYYGYLYLLSPARSWADFGKLEVVVNTPYVINYNSLSGFRQTETGYRMVRQGLPEEELYFELRLPPKSPTEQETVQEETQTPVEAESIPKENPAPWILLWIVCILAAGLLTWLLLHQWKRRNGQSSRS